MTETFLIIFIIIYIIWVINSLIVSLMAHKICNYLMYNKKKLDFDVDEVFNFHSPFRLRSWFGFKHWFYPYKK